MTDSIPNAGNLGTTAYERLHAEIARAEDIIKRGEFATKTDIANVNSSLKEKANENEVRKSTDIQPINYTEMDTETKKLFTGGAVAVVGEKAVGSENLNTELYNKVYMQAPTDVLETDVLEETGDFTIDTTGITLNSITNTYNWIIFKNTVARIEFTRNGDSDLWFIFNKGEDYVTAISLTFAQPTYGVVRKFYNNTKEDIGNLGVTTGLGENEACSVCIEDGNLVFYKCNGEVYTKWFELTGYDITNFGFIGHSSNVGKTIVKDVVKNKGNTSVKEKVLEIEENFNTKYNDVSNKIINTDNFIEENILKNNNIEGSLTADNTVSGSFWDKSDATYNTSYHFYFASKKLISVTSGDTLKLTNWGDILDSSNLAYCAYDNDGLPYDSNSARINFNQGTYNSDENSYTFVIPEGCTQIGLSIKYESLTFGDNKYSITSTATYSLGDTMNNIITEKIIDSISNSTTNDLISQMFIKGNSKKNFDKKPCIIAAGQSNIDGRIPTASLPSYITLPISNCHFASNYNNGSFEDGIQQTALSSDRWGVDLVTYYYITQVANKELYVIKCSKGGTSIDENGDNTVHWTPFYERLSSMNNSILWKFEQMIRSCISAQGNNFDIRAMIWHQGEGDRMVPDNYYTNLKCLIAYCRGIVGNQRLPFICGTISTKSSQYNSTIDIAIRKIAEEDPYVYLIDMADASLLDSYHFDADWAEYFGKCAYNYLIDAGVIDSAKIEVIKPTA